MYYVLKTQQEKCVLNSKKLFENVLVKEIPSPEPITKQLISFPWND